MPKWKAKAISLIRLQRGAFKIEEIRAQIKRQPKHQKWGQLTRELLRDGLIVSVGLSRASSRRTHGHRVGVYRRAA